MKKNKIEEIEVLDFDEKIETLDFNIPNKEEEKNSKIKDIKQFLSDKRNKALVKLIIYGIFLAAVIIYIRVVNSRNMQSKPINNTENNTNIEVLESTSNTITEKTKLLNTNNNYTFELNYFARGDSVNAYTITGTFNNQELTLLYNDIEYKYDDQGFYTIVNDEKIYENNNVLTEILSFIGTKIYSYLEKAEFQYRVEDVNNNTKINSKLKVSEFALLNNNIVENDDYIIIETTENKNNNDIFVSLNMTNYYEGLNNCTVDINFKY